MASGREQEFMRCGGANIVLTSPRFSDAKRVIPSGGDSAPDAEQLAALAHRRMNFEPPRLREMVISPTALADFGRCPRQFHFRHSLRLPEPAAYGVNGRSSAATMGTVAHAVLECLQFGTATEGEIRQLTDQLSIPAGLGLGERTTIAADLVRSIKNLGMSQRGEREVPFFYHIGDALFIRGQIDVLLEQRDRLVVRDYKYAHASDQVSRYQVQMEAYALAVANKYPQSRVEAEIMFLKDEGLAVPVPLPSAPEMRERTLALAREFLVAHATKDFPKSPPNIICCQKLQCGFVDRCWGGSVGNMR
jgi:hypothetical protein